MNDKEHKCQCSFSIRMLGDGCRYCQPQEYIDRLHDSMEDMVHLDPLTIEDIQHIVVPLGLKHLEWDEVILVIHAIYKHLKGE